MRVDRKKRKENAMPKRHGRGRVPTPTNRASPQPWQVVGAVWDGGE